MFIFFSTLFFILSAGVAQVWGYLLKSSEIAYVRTDTRDIYSMDVQRSISIPLIEHVVASSSLSWSQDGASLAFTSGSNVLHILDVREGGVQDYVIDSVQLLEEPAWSPDNRYIAFHAPSTIAYYRVYLLRLSDGAIFPLNDEDTTTVGAAWSPMMQGTAMQLAYQSLEPGCGWAIYVVELQMDSDAAPQIGDVRRLTDCGYQNMRPEWSPDGQRIVYYAQPLPGDTRVAVPPDIYVMDANGDHVQRLTHNAAAFSPSWSADGQQIVFTSSGECGAYLMNADGSDLRCLSYDRFIDIHLAWRP